MTRINDLLTRASKAEREAAEARAEADAIRDRAAAEAREREEADARALLNALPGVIAQVQRERTEAQGALVQALVGTPWAQAYITERRADSLLLDLHGRLVSLAARFDVEPPAVHIEVGRAASLLTRIEAALESEAQRQAQAEFERVTGGDE